MKQQKTHVEIFAAELSSSNTYTTTIFCRRPFFLISRAVFQNFSLGYIFFIIKSIDRGGYANDNTPGLAAEKLRNEILKWFNRNATKAKFNQSYLLLSTKEDKPATIGKKK